MIKYYFTTILYFVLLYASLSAQTKGISPVQNDAPIKTGITRAVVVGISDYQNKNITDLQYAHEDAKAFAAYLLDPKGMNIDTQNLTMLINENATSGQFISALYGLLETSKEGDLTIIYFSGHGDVESHTINQPGFLLCWDAPSKVYMAGGTFGLAYLQEIISTLSLSTKSKVIMIADACRAGKLAGNAIGGSNATAANLAKQYANEVKIMSCQPDEFSLEGKSWGNGRGVFSYYFLAGLKGLADKNNDMIVTLGEIERYLDDKVPSAVAPHSQIPMTAGNKNTPIATVDAEVLKKMKAINLEAGMAATELKGVSDFMITLDTTLQQKLMAFEKALSSGQLTSPLGTCAWDLLPSILENPQASKYAGILKRNLAAALQDEAQQAINAYLGADTKELEQRWFYGNKYAKYPDQLIKAAQLLGEQHFFYNTIMSRYHYFKGLNLRLAGENLKKDSLLLLALEDQYKSLQFLDNAPNVLNEIGWTMHLVNNHEASLEYLNKALVYAPGWALPYINLNIRYQKVKEFNKSLEAGFNAIRVDSGFVLGYQSVAGTYIQMKEYESARKYLFKSLDLDSLNQRTIDFIAYSYTLSKDYAEGAKWYQKMVSLEGFVDNTLDLNSLAYTLLLSGQKEKALEVYQKAKAIMPQTEHSYQGLIEYYFYTNDTKNAEKELKDYILMFPTDSYALYLIASLCGVSGREEECFTYLDLAFANGFKDLDTLTTDPNLVNIINKNSYTLLLKKYGLHSSKE